MSENLQIEKFFFKKTKKSILNQVHMNRQKDANSKIRLNYVDITISRFYSIKVIALYNNCFIIVILREKTTPVWLKQKVIILLKIAFLLITNY